MDRLDKDDIEAIATALAPKIVTQVQKAHHEFWIDPESHYRDHLRSRQLDSIFDADMIAALKEISSSYKKGKGILFRVFITLAAVGAFAAAVQGWFSGKSP